MVSLRGKLYPLTVHPKIKSDVTVKITLKSQLGVEYLTVTQSMIIDRYSYSFALSTGPARRCASSVSWFVCFKYL